MVFENNHKFFF